jgi:hypothetical protein
MKLSCLPTARRCHRPRRNFGILPASEAAHKKIAHLAAKGNPTAPWARPRWCKFRTSLEVTHATRPDHRADRGAEDDRRLLLWTINGP